MARGMRCAITAMGARTSVRRSIGITPAPGLHGRHGRQHALSSMCTSSVQRSIDNTCMTPSKVCSIKGTLPRPLHSTFVVLAGWLADHMHSAHAAIHGRTCGHHLSLGGGVSRQNQARAIAQRQPRRDVERLEVLGLACVARSVAQPAC